MPTKSINISATGPSWDRATWRKKVLLDLRPDDDVVIPAYYFGTSLMEELARSGVFERGFPPETGDSIVLDIDGESSDFGVHPVRGELVCYENREANPRTLRFSVEELTLHTLRRKTFYTLMAKDLGISGQVTELHRGIWELGRKSLPRRGRSKVLFIERGVGETSLATCLKRDNFNTHCLLFHDEIPRQLDIPGKLIVPGQLEVNDGRFVSEVFEDLVASQPAGAAETGIDLDVLPPELLICGEKFTLPVDRGKPTIGSRYWSFLLEHPREAISCWDIERAVKPELKVTVATAMGADFRLDERAARELDEKIREAKIELEEARKDVHASPVEIEELQDELDQLLDRKKADTARQGSSRLLGDNDKDKARRRVRKALDAVSAFVGKQSAEVGATMADSIGEGTEIYFNPPPAWKI
jgi:hypothetical protein